MSEDKKSKKPEKKKSRIEVNSKGEKVLNLDSCPDEDPDNADWIKIAHRIRKEKEKTSKRDKG